MSSSYTIGITGGSGSGKTFFIKSLSNRFTENEICLISQDHYYHPRETQKEDERGVKNFDLPESIDYKQFHQDIQVLKRGEVLKKKEYTFNNPNVTPKTLEFKPAPII